MPQRYSYLRQSDWQKSHLFCFQTFSKAHHIVISDYDSNKIYSIGDLNSIKKKYTYSIYGSCIKMEKNDRNERLLTIQMKKKESQAD
jgi:hypothetical protein